MIQKVHLDVLLEKVIIHIQIIPALCHQDAVSYKNWGDGTFGRSISYYYVDLCSMFISTLSA